MTPRKRYPRRKESERRNCEQCGSPFYGLYRPERPQKFCSRECFYISRLEKRPVGKCIGCDLEFQIKKGRNKFCSHPCFCEYKSRNKITAEERRRRVRIQRQGFYAQNREMILRRSKHYAARNPSKIKARWENYWRNNKSILQEKRKQRLERDVNFKLRTRLSIRIHDALTRRKLYKCQSTGMLVGCSMDFLRGYLEARFTKGMSWENYGSWHIDHVIPCAEFDLRDPAQQKQCFHYSNLQPLWAAQNLSKGAKRPSAHQAGLI